MTLTTENIRAALNNTFKIASQEDRIALGILREAAEALLQLTVPANAAGERDIKDLRGFKSVFDQSGSKPDADKEERAYAALQAQPAYADFKRRLLQWSDGGLAGNNSQVLDVGIANCMKDLYLRVIDLENQTGRPSTAT